MNRNLNPQVPKSDLAPSDSRNNLCPQTHKLIAKVHRFDSHQIMVPSQQLISFKIVNFWNSKVNVIM